jgi:predicted enzyme related to lactoylglutathione lyase
MTHLDPSRLCQIEIHTPDLQKSLDFYEHVFSWKRAPIDLHNYVVLAVPENCPFGISLIPDTKALVSNSVILYFGVTDPKPFADRAAQYGGKASSPRKLPGYGTITIIEDIHGQKFGLFENYTP